MNTQFLDKGWTFSRPRAFSEAVIETVNLPHDWSVSQPRRPDAASGASGGFFPGAELCYERELELPEHGAALLEFEGVYCNAEVRLNGSLIHTNHCGYNGFLVDLASLTGLR